MHRDVERMANSIRRGDVPGDLPWTDCYDELRRVARRALLGRRSKALDTTVLLHEAYLRLAGSDVSVKDRAHFFALCSTVMRGLVIDELRKSAAEKHGGGLQQATLTTLSRLSGPGNSVPVDALDLERALDRLGGVSQELVHLVEMKVYGGMTNDEIATALGTSRSTVKRQWLKTRSLLSSLLQQWSH